MPRPHYFCHISLMLLSTAALAAQVRSVAPPPATESVRTDGRDAPAPRQA